MPYDLAAERVLPVLESFDPGRSDDARAAWDWLTASGDVPNVMLRDLEYFLWYQLPAKFLTSEEQHRTVALALGGLLGDIGYEDAAGVCRSPVTMNVLAEWERDRSCGHRALTERILIGSGVRTLKCAKSPSRDLTACPTARSTRWPWRGRACETSAHAVACTSTVSWSRSSTRSLQSVVSSGLQRSPRLSRDDELPRALHVAPDQPGGHSRPSS